MGKYMCKDKDSDEVSSMEVFVLPLGVCTRSRMVALQKQQVRAQGQHGKGAAREYLELRSRKIEKMPPHKASKRTKHRRKTTQNDKAKSSLGDNTFTMETTTRSSRETTPCNLIISSEMITTNGSTTRPSHSTSNGMAQAPVHYITPDLAKMNEYFAVQTRQDQQAFMDKYNFDPVNDCPLPGRYEWVKLK